MTTTATKANEVWVYMLANDHGKDERLVSIPASENESCNTLEDFLELVFKYGQNDFQPVAETCSVSLGDVVEYRGKDGEADHARMFIVRANGFGEISVRDWSRYMRIPQEDRTWSEYVRPSLAN